MQQQPPQAPPAQPVAPQQPPSMPPPQMAAPPFTPPHQQPNAGMVIDIDADAAWEPIEQTDFLEKDGFFCCQIIRENARNDDRNTPGIFLTLQIQDEDMRGKTISKFMTDPKASKNDTRFVWRLLVLSITGNKDQARSALRYQPGMFTGQKCYVKTNADVHSKSGKNITNVDNFVTQAEWEQAVKENRHRWAPQQKAKSAVGTPPGFGAPAGGFAPLQAMVGGPSAPTAPAPTGQPPMQSAPQSTGFPPAGHAQQPAQPAAPQAPTTAPQPSGAAPAGFPPPPGGQSS